MADYYLEDFEPGHTYTSATHTISNEEALDFARRYDPQYFHLDPVAARDSVFGGLVLGSLRWRASAWTNCAGTNRCGRATVCAAISRCSMPACHARTPTAAWRVFATR